MTPFSEWREAPPGDFAVIGDPVSHSRSPQMQQAAFEAMGLHHSYSAVRVPAGEVASALRHLSSLGYLGINVTVPHKAEARAAMDEVDFFAARCNSVNTIGLGSEFTGMNTDGPGFLDTLAGLVPKGCTVLLLGAGGSARAIALALSIDGYPLKIFNRTPERASSLVRELAIDAEVVANPDLAGIDLVVNATSASLTQDSLPVSFAGHSGAVAYDLVYGETPFLQAAHEAGLRTVDGKQLLAAQGARSIEFWLGGIAPRDVMLNAIQ